MTKVTKVQLREDLNDLKLIWMTYDTVKLSISHPDYLGLRSAMLAELVNSSIAFLKGYILTDVNDKLKYVLECKSYIEDFSDNVQICHTFNILDKTMEVKLVSKISLVLAQLTNFINYLSAKS